MFYIVCIQYCKIVLILYEVMGWVCTYVVWHRYDMGGVAIGLA